jgi:hypothetical protein
MIIDDELETSNHSKPDSAKKQSDMMNQLMGVSQKQAPRMTVQDRLKLKRKSALLVTDDMMLMSQKNNSSNGTHNINQFAVMRKSKIITSKEHQNLLEMLGQPNSNQQKPI